MNTEASHERFSETERLCVCEREAVERSECAYIQRKGEHESERERNREYVDIESVNTYTLTRY